MHQLTNIDLGRRSEIELHVLFGMVTQAIARTEPGSPERQVAWTNVETVRRALRRKLAAPAP